MQHGFNQCEVRLKQHLKQQMGKGPLSQPDGGGSQTRCGPTRGPDEGQLGVGQMGARPRWLQGGLDGRRA